MSKGFVVLAQNTKDINYVEQAYALALSLKKTQKINSISLVTNDVVLEKYKLVFDKIIPIPFNDQASNSEWKVENRWKLYHASPYDETIVLDVDMLVLNDLSLCWNFVRSKDLFFTSVVKNYKGQEIIKSPYRKMFTENDLPNIYTGMFYFKKSDFSLTFFKLLEYISYNWQRFFYEIAPNHLQDFFSMDVAVAIAVKILGIDDEVLHADSPFTFVHMKPALQGWDPVPASCYSQVLVNFNSGGLIVGGYRQSGVFHYVEPKFLTKQILENLSV